MKHRSSKWMITTASICSILLVASFTISSGTGWATVFGKDFGVSISKGNLNVSVGMGGFYHWWEAFAEREFEPRNFGAGYDSTKSSNSDWQFFPIVAQPKKGWPSTLVLPIWILVAIMLSVTRYFGVSRNKQEAEQVMHVNRP